MDFKLSFVLLGLVAFGGHVTNAQSGNAASSCTSGVTIQYIPDLYDPCYYYLCIGGVFINYKYPCIDSSSQYDDSICNVEANQCSGIPTDPIAVTQVDVGPTTTTSTTTTPAIPSTTIPMSYIDGGAAQSGLSTLDQCHDACVANTDCWGYSFRTDQTIMCSFHLNRLDICPPPTSSPTATLVLFSVCTPGITLTAGSHVSGGTMTAFQTIRDCDYSCSQDSGCVAYDFDTASPTPCYHHTATTICNPIAPLPTSTHVVFTPCVAAPGGIPDINAFLSGFSHPDGVLTPGVTDLCSCFAACGGATTCYGFDFNYVDNSCYLFTAGQINCDGQVACETCVTYMTTTQTTACTAPVTT